jgi:hypothetical protein
MLNHKARRGQEFRQRTSCNQREQKQIPCTSDTRHPGCIQPHFDINLAFPTHGTRGASCLPGSEATSSDAQAVEIAPTALNYHPNMHLV